MIEELLENIFPVLQHFLIRKIMKPETKIAIAKRIHRLKYNSEKAAAKKVAKETGATKFQFKEFEEIPEDKIEKIRKCSTIQYLIRAAMVCDDPIENLVIKAEENELLKIGLNYLSRKQIVTKNKLKQLQLKTLSL